MDDLIDVLDLRPLLQVHAIDVGDTNFEVLYSPLYPDESKSELCKVLERRVRAYFGALSLRNAPAIYDHLVLFLREKDAIATFNWDPFLWQAAARNSQVSRGPKMFFFMAAPFWDIPEDIERRGSFAHCAVSIEGNVSRYRFCIRLTRKTTQMTYISPRSGGRLKPSSTMLSF